MKNFYCVFVRTENNLIAFLGPSYCVNTQYAALSRAMNGPAGGHMFYIEREKIFLSETARPRAFIFGM